MTRRNSVRVLIFSFAVLVVLLRPYAAYQISMRADMTGDPVKVNNLLQRLIKKKDEHRTVSSEHFEAIVPAKTTKFLPLILLLSIFQAFAFIPVSLKRYQGIFSAFQTYQRPKYYLSLLCIRL